MNHLATVENLVFLIGRLIGPEEIELIGTGFLTGKAGFYATAGHVTGGDERNLVVIDTTTNIIDYQDTTSEFAQYRPVKIYAFDPFRDICILKCEDLNRQLPLGGTDEVTTGMELCIVGFPHCTSGRRVLTYQKSNVGAKVLLGTDSIKSKYLILNLQTRPGQSGSPIINPENGKVIAMLLGAWTAPGGSVSIGGVDPNTLHQTSHAISAEYINKMII